MKFLGQGFQILEQNKTDRQTHTQTRPNALPSEFEGVRRKKTKQQTR